MRHAAHVATIEGEDSGQRRGNLSAAPGGLQLRDDRAADLHSAAIESLLFASRTVLAFALAD
jgi:hypothetical protein